MPVVDMHYPDGNGGSSPAQDVSIRPRIEVLIAYFGSMFCCRCGKSPRFVQSGNQNSSRIKCPYALESPLRRADPEQNEIRDVFPPGLHGRGVGRGLEWLAVGVLRETDYATGSFLPAVFFSLLATFWAGMPASFPSTWKVKNSGRTPFSQGEIHGQEVVCRKSELRR